MDHFPLAPKGPAERAPVSPRTVAEAVPSAPITPAPGVAAPDRIRASPRVGSAPPTADQIATARQHFPRLLTAARKAAAAGKHAEATRLLAPITDTYPTAAAHPRARTPELPQALELQADLQVRSDPAAAADTYAKAIEIWTLMALDLEAAARLDNARVVRTRIDKLSAKRVAAYRTGARAHAQTDRLISQDKRRPGLGSIGHA